MTMDRSLPGGFVSSRRTRPLPGKPSGEPSADPSLFGSNWLFRNYWGDERLTVRPSSIFEGD